MVIFSAMNGSYIFRASIIVKLRETSVDQHGHNVMCFWGYFLFIFSIIVSIMIYENSAFQFGIGMMGGGFGGGFGGMGMGSCCGCCMPVCMPMCMGRGCGCGGGFGGGFGFGRKKRETVLKRFAIYLFPLTEIRR